MGHDRVDDRASDRVNDRVDDRASDRVDDRVDGWFPIRENVRDGWKSRCVE